VSRDPLIRQGPHRLDGFGVTAFAQDEAEQTWTLGVGVTMIEVERIGEAQFALYGAIPARFAVTSLFRVEPIDGGLGGFRLIEEDLGEPYVKAYGGDGPTEWAEGFELSGWAIFVAREGRRPVGGAAVATGGPVYPLDRFQREDLAVLWDIRVHPDRRRRGIGTRLFQHSVGWARREGYGQLGAETQSVNVPACRFYASQGCTLGAVHRFGYAGCPDVADEAMLLWYMEL
jgi:GNAT superfamily N-acetyltransferase